MSDQAIIELLRGADFFHGIADEHLQRVAALTRIVEVPAQTNVFSQYDPAKDVYIVVSGEVSLVICEAGVGCRQLTVVRPGEFLGWSPLVGRERLSDTARALSPTRLLAIDGEAMLNLCRQHPEFGFEIMHRLAQTLSQRLGATRVQLLRLGGASLPEVPLETD